MTYRIKPNYIQEQDPEGTIVEGASAGGGLGAGMGTGELKPNIIPPPPEPARSDQTETKGVDYLNSTKQVAVGGGNQTFRVTEKGTWLGADKFSSAPFSVDMNGNLISRTATIGGNLTIGVAVGESIQAAINTVAANGGGTVLLGNGIHTLTGDLTLASGIYLVGQSSESCILDFQTNSAGVVCQGSGASTVTVGVTNDSTTVTSSAQFTAGMVGKSILLDGFWFPIVAFTNTSTITIAVPFAGSTATIAATVATIIQDVKINTLTIRNSYTAGISMRYANEIVVDDVAIQGCAYAISVQDTSNIEINKVDCVYNAYGIYWTNVHLSVIRTTGVIDSTTGDGFNLNGCTTNVVEVCFSFNNAGNGYTATSCQDVGFIFSNSINNAGKGVELVSGNNNVLLSTMGARNNGSDGIKLTATSDKCIINGCFLNGNGGWGVNIAASTCDENVVFACQYGSNSSGDLNNQGTDTNKSVFSSLLVVLTDSSSALWSSADTEKNGTNTATYAKVKSIRVLIQGTLTAKFDWKASSDLGTAYAKIYVNGVAYSSEENTSSTTYATVTVGAIPVKAGDTIELWSKGDASYYGIFRNFRLYATEGISPLHYTVVVDA